MPVRRRGRMLTRMKSPLLLSLFTTILPNSRWAAHLLWTAADAIAAWALVAIWRRRQGVAESSRDWLVAASCVPPLRGTPQTLIELQVPPEPIRLPPDIGPFLIFHRERAGAAGSHVRVPRYVPIQPLSISLVLTMMIRHSFSRDTQPRHSIATVIIIDTDNCTDVAAAYHLTDIPAGVPSSLQARR